MIGKCRFSTSIKIDFDIIVRVILVPIFVTPFIGLIYDSISVAGSPLLLACVVLIRVGVIFKSWQKVDLWFSIFAKQRISWHDFD